MFDEGLTVELGAGRTVESLSTGKYRPPYLRGPGQWSGKMLGKQHIRSTRTGRYRQPRWNDPDDDEDPDTISDEMGDDLDPVALGAGRTAVQLVTGEFSTCALLDDGSVKCWGRNDSGQLGLGGTTDSLVPANLVDLGPGLKAVELAAGLAHVCALLTDGSVKCWGSNSHGQLGLGDANNRRRCPRRNGRQTARCRPRRPQNRSDRPLPPRSQRIPEPSRLPWMLPPRKT